jgi:hypothetical protein
MHTVLFTSVFQRQADAAGPGEEELQAIAVAIAAEPLSGDLTPGTGGARKLRFERSGSGKSGGYRKIHYFGGSDVPAFLLALIDKRQRENLTAAERNELAHILPRIADAYRKGSRT